MDEDNLRLWKLLAAPMALSAFIGSAGSVAIVLRSGDPITARLIIQALLSSFAAASIVFLIIYTPMMKYSNPSALYGVSALAGVGGAATLDLLLSAFRRWAQSKMRPPEKE